MTEISLNGIWQFEFVEGKCADPLTVPLTSVAAVPSCFDAEDFLFGKYGTGIYRRTLDCCGQVRLSFAGGINIRVYWDGAEVGRSTLAYTLEDYEFDAGIPGLHELTIAADNVLQGTDDEIFKEYYDFYCYGGIYSSVTLEAIGAETISRVQVTPLDHLTGEVEIALEFPDTPEAAEVQIAFDHGTPETVTYSAPIRRKVPNHRIWSPDTPEIHALTVARDGWKREVKFGIRTLDWRSGRLCLNGDPIRLIGYNRHEFHPDFGASTPLPVIRNDLVRIKLQGCNFIRGSHYPQREEMLELCDQLGLLVWDESLGWGNRPESLQNPVFQVQQKEQTVKMVRRSYNHPSVIMWGFLNECASDTEEGCFLIGKLCTAIRENDRSRPVSYASNRCMSDISLKLPDIISFNIYPGWYDPNPQVSGIGNITPKLTEVAEFVSAKRFANKPFIISEIGAGAFLGDHSGVRWSEEYQAQLLKTSIDTIFTNPRFSGLAIWQYCNCRTYISTQNYFSRPRGYNNKGVLDEYRKPKAAWDTVTKSISKYFGL